MSIPSHPIRLVGGHDLQRSRLTVFFRLILVIPHVIVLAVYAIGVFFAEIIAWFAALFTGRVPLSLHDFIEGYVRYSARVLAYAHILADPFPPFGSGGSASGGTRFGLVAISSRSRLFHRTSNA